MLVARFVPRRVWMRLRPDAVAVWDDPEVRGRLDWYYRVMVDEAPARFILARLVEAGEDPSKLETGQLWELHDRLAREAWSLFRGARRGSLGLGEALRMLRGMNGWSYMHVKAELAWRNIRSCTLCERRCRVDRTRGIGACRLDSGVYVHSWFHHLGEEAPLVPSGTIFYGGCNFRCVYCQNYDVSQTAPRAGERVDARRLAEMQRELRLTGARNINHVGGDPVPSMHVILESFLYLDVNVPQLWNSNMYMTVEAMKLLRDVIDIWLPDFKYGNNRCATRLSAAPRYLETVTRNLRMAVEAGGDMIIRHLILPGHLECCTKPVLRWIAENLPKDRVLVNIMDQYRPEYMVLRYPRSWPELARTPTMGEVEEARRLASSLGLVYEPVS